MACSCADDLIGKQLAEAAEWVSALYLTVASGTTVTQMSDQWLDCRNWQDYYLLIEFHGTNGGNLTVKLQTAVAVSMDSDAWNDVTSASVTMTNSTAVIEAPHWLTMPPLGVLRLTYTASGGVTVTGVVRVQVLRKEAA